MTTTRINIDEFNALRTSSDYADKLRAAAILKEQEGDTEIAEAMRTLSAQLDFTDRTGDTSEIERARTKLHELIVERSHAAECTYHSYMSDEDILALSSGEVTNPEGVDDVLCKFNKGGLYDPSIFGGDGLIPKLKENKKEVLEDARKTMASIGHITLPMYCVNERDADEIGVLLGMPEESVLDILYGKLWLDTEEGVLIHAGKRDALIRQGETLNDRFISYGGAIRQMLIDLNLPDHPERYTFRVLPVMNLASRLCVIDPETLQVTETGINRLYRSVIFNSNHVRKLMELNCPDIITNAKKMALQASVNELFAGHNADNRMYEGLCDSVRSAAKKRVPYFYSASLMTAMRYRIVGVETPKAEGMVESISPDVLNVEAKLFGRDERVPLTDVLVSLSD